MLAHAAHTPAATQQRSITPTSAVHAGHCNRRNQHRSLRTVITHSTAIPWVPPPRAQVPRTPPPPGTLQLLECSTLERGSHALSHLRCSLTSPSCVCSTLHAAGGLTVARAAAGRPRSRPALRYIRAIYTSLHNLHTARNARTVCSAGLHHPGHQRPIWTPQARLDAAQVGAQVRAYNFSCDLTEYSSGGPGLSSKNMAKTYFPQALWNSSMGRAQLNKRALAVGLRRPRGKPL